MLSIKRHIPNFFTSLNVVSGSIAIVFALQSDLLLAFYFILIGAFFDFVDGGVARLLNVQSEVGKQLDSLCDVVTFGVAPGAILFTMMRHALGLGLPIEFSSHTLVENLYLLSVVLVPVFSAIRLAKFNVDTRQTDSFIGLPVPANALFISALGVVFISGNVYWMQFLLVQPYVLLAISIVQSYLLVSSLPMFALKFKNLSWKNNKLRFIFLLFSAVLLIFTKAMGIAIVIVLYIAISISARILRR